MLGAAVLSVFAALALAGCGPSGATDADSPPEAADLQPEPPIVGEPATPTPTPTATPEPPPPEFSVLVFSRTGGFRHSSIRPGIEAVKKLGAERGYNVEATEDPTRFTSEGLAPFKVILFLNTTGEILNDEQQAAMERHVRGGGGYVGLHAAADTEYDWPWYGRLLGAWFEIHPRIQEARVIVEDREHPATKHLGETWTRTDEWYDYRTNPRQVEGLRVLASLDPGSYRNSRMTEDHPIVWCQEFDGGRSFYSGLGHTDASYAEPAFLDLLHGGIRWAAGVEN